MNLTSSQGFNSRGGKQMKTWRGGKKKRVPSIVFPSDFEDKC